MFNQSSILGTISRVVLIIAIISFMGACSDNHNPLNTGANIADENGSSSVSELTFITRPQTTTSLQKIVTDAKMIYISQGGELEINSGDDFELIELIEKAPYPVTTYELGQALLNATPLSPTVLMTLCENTDMRDDYWMFTVLKENAPLRKCVIEKMLDKNFITNSYSLKTILVASSPLPQSVLDRIYQITINPSDRDLVLAAQNCPRMDESFYNNAGGGLKINLEIPPYSIVENTYISLSTDDAYLMGDVYLTFGPHGTLFSPPAILNFQVSGLDLSGIDPDLVDIFYDNQDNGLWELMPRESITIDVEAGYIEVEDAEFSHFSRYAIGMR